MSEETTQDEGRATLEGVLSILAALGADSRPIYSILLRDDRTETPHQRLLTAAQRAGVPVQRVPLSTIDDRAGGRTHGGALAEVGPRRFRSLSTLAEGEAVPFIVMLDGVEDPFNFGQAVRSLWAAGAHGLVVRPRNWMSAAAVVARASAGMSERIPTAVSETAEDAAQFFKERGFSVACADGDPVHSVEMYDADLRIPLFLLIGGEKRGVSRAFLREAALRLRVPYGRSAAPDLGTAAAAAILGFEVARQRRNKPGSVRP